MKWIHAMEKKNICVVHLNKPPTDIYNGRYVIHEKRIQSSRNSLRLVGLGPFNIFQQWEAHNNCNGKQPKGCYSDLRNKTIFSKRKERSDKGKNRRRWSTSSLLYPSSNPKRHLVQYLISRINMAFGLGWFWPTLASQYSMGHCLAYKVSAWSSLDSKQTRFYSLLWPGSIE